MGGTEIFATNARPFSRRETPYRGCRPESCLTRTTSTLLTAKAADAHGAPRPLDDEERRSAGIVAALAALCRTAVLNRYNGALPTVEGPPLKDFAGRETVPTTTSDRHPIATR